MGAEITNSENGVVAIKVTGKLAEAELAAVQQRVAEIIRVKGKIRILVQTESFEGWDRGKWDDFSMQEKNDVYIEKMAIVGDKQWQDLALIFTAKGLRPFPIEYFAPGELAKARAWLASH